MPKYEPLTDEQWARISFFIFENDRGKPRTRNRECFEAIRYVLMTGTQWANLSLVPGFPPKSTVHDRFQNWVNEGFFDRLLKWLQPDELEDLSLYHLDATVKVAKKGRPDFKSAKIQGKQNHRSGKPARSAA